MPLAVLRSLVEPAPVAPRALVVLSDRAAIVAGDTLAINRLGTAGVTVVAVASDDDAEWPGTHDLIYISDSCSSGTLVNKYGTSTRPIFHGESGSWDDVGVDLSGAATDNSTTGSVNFTAAAVARGLAAATGVTAIYTAATNIPTVPITSLGAGAVVLATQAADATLAVAWTYEIRSALLNGHTAEARRVAWRIPAASFGTLNAAGLALWDGLLTWLNTEPPAPDPTVVARTSGVNDTALAQHAVAAPAGSGGSLLVFFTNDVATVTASTLSAGWEALGTQQQGVTTNHRGTVFYAADADTAAALLVDLSTAEQATWIALRVADAGTPVVAGTNASGLTFTAPSLTGLDPANYLAVLGTGTDASTTTTQSLTYPAGWINPQSINPGVTSSAATFTVEQSFTGVTSITPGTITLAATEQIVSFLVAFPPTGITGGGGAGEATVRAVSQATANNATTIIVPKPAGTLDGDELLCLIIQDSDAVFTGLGPGTSGFAQTGADGTEVATSPMGRVFARQAGAAEPSSYTFAISNGSSTIAMMWAVAGADPATPIRLAPTWSTGTTQDETSPGTTGGVAGDLLLVAYADQGGTTPSSVTHTTPTGMTESHDVATTWITGAADYETLAADGATTGRTSTRSQAASGQYRSMALLVAAAPVVTGPTVVDETDSFDLTEAATLAVTASAVDTVALTDAGALVATGAGVDAGTLAEVAALTATAAGLDSATLAEQAAVTVTVAGADTASTTETTGSAATLAGLDSAAAADTAGLLATLDGADAVTLTEQSTLDAGSALDGADLATLTDLAVVVAAGFGADTATATDAGAVSVATAGVDSAALTEQAALGVVLDGADTASTTEATAVFVPLAGSDTAALTEATGSSTSLDGLDSAGLVEDATAATSYAFDGADSATLTEQAALVVALDGADAGSATEAAGTPAAALAGGDTLATTDAATIAAILTGTDAAADTASADLLATLAGSDGATSTDLANPAAAVGAADGATATDSAALGAAFGLVDSSTASDAASVLGALAGVDDAVLDETATVAIETETLAAADAASVAESGSISASVQGSDTAATVDTGGLLAAGSGVDDADLVEQAALTASPAVTDTAALAETAALALTATDTAELDEAGVLAADAAGADSAALTEAGLGGLLLDDTATLSEAAAPAVTLAVADAATLTDLGSLGTESSKSGTDSAASTEVATVAVAAVGVDPSPAVLAEQALTAATGTSTDSAALTEVASVLILLTVVEADDTATLTDTATASAALLGADSATTGETSAITGISFAVADAATHLDAAAVGRSSTASDSATLDEQATTAGGPPAQVDAASLGVEVGSVLARVDAADLATMAETASLVVLLAAGDTASATETTATGTVSTVSDAATLHEAAAVFDLATAAVWPLHALEPGRREHVAASGLTTREHVVAGAPTRLGATPVAGPWFARPPVQAGPPTRRDHQGEP